MVYMRVSLFFLVFSFLSLQMIYRRTLEFRDEYFLSSQKNKKIKKKCFFSLKSDMVKKRYFLLLIFFHIKWSREKTR